MHRLVQAQFFVLYLVRPGQSLKGIGLPQSQHLNSVGRDSLPNITFGKSTKHFSFPQIGNLHFFCNLNSSLAFNYQQRNKKFNKFLFFAKDFAPNAKFATQRRNFRISTKRAHVKCTSCHSRRSKPQAKLPQHHRFNHHPGNKKTKTAKNHKKKNKNLKK
jgi:hypothetical protein